MYPQVQDVDFRASVPRPEVPAYVMQGRHELTARSRFADEWIEELQAPIKRSYEFENSGHNPDAEESERFDDMMIKFVLPETYRRRASRAGPGEDGGMLMAHAGKRPQVDPAAWVAPDATVCGDVVIGSGARVMHGARLIGEAGGSIRIGRDCIVMENAVVRAGPRHSCVIGDHCLIGPNAHVTGATLED